MFCKKCGDYFERDPKKPSQTHCPKCSFWMNRGGGKYLKVINAKAAELKRAADESGDPKIYRAEKYSQEFLRGLIPSRQ